MKLHKQSTLFKSDFQKLINNIYKINRKDMKQQLFPQKIYQIILDGSPIYVGATIQTLQRRMGIHKHSQQHSILRDRFNDLIVEQIDTVNSSDELYKEELLFHILSVNFIYVIY